MSTSKTVLAILVLLASVPIAQAQGTNPRYPAYAGQRADSLQSRSVSSPKLAYFPPQDAWMSRASRSYGGGGY